MMSLIKPYLQLVRLPNLFTAAADSLAGWLIVRGSLNEPQHWLPLVLASVMIYAAGIILNDVFDFEVDHRERPNRPLPSGRVSRNFAAWFGGGLLILGPVVAGLSGSVASLVVGLILALSVLSYDAGMKRTVLGPEVMGACRALNLLLGLSQSPQMGGPGAWLVAVGLGLFIMGVTWISRSEVETGQTRGLVAGLILQNLGFATIVLGLIWLNDRGTSGSLLPMGGDGLMVIVVVAAIVNRAGFRAYHRPVPETFQRAVKTGVLSLVWIDVATVASVQGPRLALVVAGLWFPAFWLGRWLYST